jgi:hypothetical protein
MNDWEFSDSFRGKRVQVNVGVCTKKGWIFLNVLTGILM